MSHSRLDDRAADPWPTLEDALRDAAAIAEHARHFYGEGLKSVWLYGSRARGDHHADSDLDVLLVRDPPAGLGSIETHEDWMNQPFQDMLEERMSGYSVLFSPIQINSARPEQMDTWDTMFFRSVREDGIQVL